MSGAIHFSIWGKGLWLRPVPRNNYMWCNSNVILSAVGISLDKCVNGFPWNSVFNELIPWSSWTVVLFAIRLFITADEHSINVSLRLDTLAFSVDPILLSLPLVIIIVTSGRKGDNERVWGNVSPTTTTYVPLLVLLILHVRLGISVPTQVNWTGPGQKYPFDDGGGEDVRVISGTAEEKNTYYLVVKGGGLFNPSPWRVWL